MVAAPGEAAALGAVTVGAGITVTTVITVGAVITMGAVAAAKTGPHLRLRLRRRAVTTAGVAVVGMVVGKRLLPVGLEG